MSALPISSSSSSSSSSPLFVTPFSLPDHPTFKDKIKLTVRSTVIFKPGTVEAKENENGIFVQKPHETQDDVTSCFFDAIPSDIHETKLPISMTADHIDIKRYLTELPLLRTYGDVTIQQTYKRRIGTSSVHHTYQFTSTLFEDHEKYKWSDVASVNIQICIEFKNNSHPFNEFIIPITKQTRFELQEITNKSKSATLCYIIDKTTHKVQIHSIILNKIHTYHPFFTYYIVDANEKAMEKYLDAINLYGKELMTQFYGKRFTGLTKLYTKIYGRLLSLDSSNSFNRNNQALFDRLAQSRFDVDKEESGETHDLSSDEEGGNKDRHKKIKLNPRSDSNEQSKQ